MAKKILRFTQDMAVAREEVTRLGGRVIHQFSPTVFVAELPDAADQNALAASTDQPTQPLDAVSQLAVTAWTTAKAAKLVRVAAAPSQTEGLSWDTPGFEPPREFGTPVAAARAAVDPEVVAESTGTPTSLYLIGSVAVGVVMVSRDMGTEVLTDAERIRIVQEVQEGLDWLAGVEPRARVSFVYDIRPVTVSSAPGPYAGVTEPYERFERDWRDSALATMGYGPGRPGYQQYANDLRSSQHTDWAYVAFFTKYPLNHFAYAVVEKVVMSYANDGWGPDDINRVFAHESCHIFGAADEYGSCACGSASGHLAVPNNNCVNCFPPGAQIPCLMNANTLAMCDFSRRQIGWDNSLFPPPAFSNWELLDNNSASTAIMADGNALYQLHNNGRIWKYVSPPLTGWQELDNNPATKQVVAAGGNLYQLHQGGRIWRYVGPPMVGWQELDNNPDTTLIVADGNALYQMHNNGRIWQYTGPPLTGWQELDNNPATQKIVAAGGNLYQMHNNGRIWQYTGPPLTGWQELDNNPASVDIVADGNDLYQMHNDGRIWKYVGPPLTGWQELDNNPATKQIVTAGGNLYQLHNTGAIWKYVGPPLTGWQQIDNNPASVAITSAGGNLWQLHSSGFIWRYTG